MHSSVEGHLVYFQVLAITNNAVVNIVEQESWWYAQERSWSRLIPNFLRNCQTDFQSGVVQVCTSTSSGIVFPLLRLLLQHRLSWVFFILAILTGVRWYLRAVLICISLMTKDVVQFLKCLSVNSCILPWYSFLIKLFNYTYYMHVIIMFVSMYLWTILTIL